MYTPLFTVNHNFNPAIGYLQPAICNDDLVLGDLLISDRLKQLGKKSSHLLTIEEQKKLKNDTEKTPKFQQFLPEKPVLLNLPLLGPREFEKETSAKRGQVFLIHSLDYRQVPIMFKLQTLNGKRIKGNQVCTIFSAPASSLERSSSLIFQEEETLAF